MSDLERFGVSMDRALLEAFDALTRQKGYGSRSEAIRDVVRNFIVAHEWERADAEVVGAVTLVYDHHRPDLADVLNDIQHEHTDAIVCSTHIHLDAHNCLEIIAMRGRADRVRAIADRLIATRGVKHGQLVSTTTGKHLH
jgi:CopG family nickel-responsive transcriptional regulator